MVAACAAAQLAPKQARKPKNEDKEPPTQTLPLLKDPPAAVAAETSKLAFHVSPLSGKGLLSPQTREAIGALMKMNRGAQIVKLRAFVAGTGDLRRVQSIVSEIFTEKKQPLPALSAIQVGALPLEGAQVVIESVSVEKKAAHSLGLVFFSGQKGESGAEAVRRLAEKAVGIAAPMLRVTCFLGSIEQAEMVRGEAARTFPMAALDLVQPVRAEEGQSAVCEGVGSRARSGAEVEVTSEMAAVSTPKLVLSGAQMAFGGGDDDLRLAFRRLEKTLEPLGVSYREVVFSSIYTLTGPMEEKAGRIAGEFFSRERRTAGTMAIFEGLPSVDATAAVEVVAAGR
jgi:enamine deaminase RidA (YjgF/YER057c/UK114 family)